MSSFWCVSSTWPGLLCKRAQQEQGSFPKETWYVGSSFWCVSPMWYSSKDRVSFAKAPKNNTALRLSNRDTSPHPALKSLVFLVFLWCKVALCVGSLHIRSLLEKKPVFVGLFLVFLWCRVALLCRLPTYQVSFVRKPCVCWALLQKSPGHMGDTHAHTDTGRGGTIFLDAYLSVRRNFSLCTYTCMCIYSAYRDL